MPHLSLVRHACAFALCFPHFPVDMPGRVAAVNAVKVRRPVFVSHLPLRKQSNGFCHDLIAQATVIDLA